MQPIFGPKQPLTTISIVPAVKWIGGKRKLVSQLIQHMPASVRGSYFEPFAGGAAVFCELVSTGRITGRSVLADHNIDLMALYRQMKSKPDGLISELWAYDKEYKGGTREQASALYYRERDAWNAGDHRPSRFVFLKQTAFNGLWRVNKQGQLNAAWGKYGFPDEGTKTQSVLICNEPNIRAWNLALKNTELLSGDSLAPDFLKVKRGDVVYLDPPYYSTFTGYTHEGFTNAQQEQLLLLAAEWSAGGATVVYSNSPESEAHVRRLWPKATIEWVTTSYTVNRSAEGRAGKKELIAWA